MNVVYFTAKVYKVVNNVQTFFANFKFFCACDDDYTSKSGSTKDFAIEAVNDVDLPSILTYFYYTKIPNNWDSRMSSQRWIASQFGHAFDITPFENSIIRIVIDEHRRIDITVGAISVGDDQTNCTLSYVYYYDNSIVSTLSNFGGPSIQLYTSYESSQSQMEIPALMFPSPNGTKICAAYGHSYDTWNIYTGKYELRYSARRWTSNYNLVAFMQGFEPSVYDPGNPYIDGGTSEIGGGGGNFSEDSDDVDVDNLPTINAVGTGFATLFTPTKSQLRHLADVMWDSNVFTALQNLVENITGMFTSLAIVPFEVSAGNTVEVTWFGMALTEIYLTLASQQYYEFDMGSINMKTDGRIFTSGSALDYSPFSSLGIFLPFIGFQELDIDECRDAIINLKYRIDILSGTCVALISLNGNTVYQFTGNCLSQIPITNENMQSLVTDAVQVGIAAAATHSAKGAVGAAEASMGEAETAKEAKAAKAALGHAEAHLAQTKAGLASATANASMGMKPVYGKAGAISASASLLAVKQPYLFLRTPRQSIPDHYQRYCGFPSNMSGKLSSFSGYTVVEDIRLNGLVATSPEVAEIYQLLKGGVII